MQTCRGRHWCCAVLSPALTVPVQTRSGGHWCCLCTNICTTSASCANADLERTVLVQCTALCKYSAALILLSPGSSSADLQRKALVLCCVTTSAISSSANQVWGALVLFSVPTFVLSVLSVQVQTWRGPCWCSPVHLVLDKTVLSFPDICSLRFQP